MALDDDLAGGFSNYYNPAFGLMAIQQPEMFVQHLASRGVPPPADFPADFSHQDAHMLMASADRPQGMTRAQGKGWDALNPQQREELDQYWRDRGVDPRSFSNRRGPQPLPGQTPRQMVPAPEPAQPPAAPSGTTRYNFQPLNQPGQSVTLPNRDQPSPQPSPSGPIPFADTTSDGSGGILSDKWFRNLFPTIPKNSGDISTDAVPNPDAPYAPPVKPQPPPTPIPPGTTPALERPTSDMTSVPSTPLPRARPPDEPTPSSDSPSTAGGASVPAGDTSDKPGNLNVEDPNAKAAATSEDKKKTKGDSQDSFGKALAGLSAMKPPAPVLPHPGPLPHPSNQISRSTLPTELLKEMSQIGHPSRSLTLGRALRGG